MKTFVSLSLLICIALSTGCRDPYADGKEVAAKKDEPIHDEPIFNKKTQDIGEFDPEDDSVEVSDGKVKGMNPLIPGTALKAYGPAVEKISKLHIQQAIAFFEAEKGRKPKDYDEFMNEIILKNNIELPVLPGTMQYQYDAENCELIVVSKKKGNK